MGELLRRIHYLLHRRRFDAELESDMDFHREMSARQGGNNFGNELRMREHAREAWGWMWLDRLAQDLRWSGRELRRKPGSALAMIVLLALGMGGVTALFGPLYSLVLSPLPFPHSDRLVRITGGTSLLDLYANHSFFKDRRSLDPIFSDVMAYSSNTSTLSSGGPSERVDVIVATQEFFATLGVQPNLGRGFPPDPKVAYYHDSSDVPGVIVSDKLWRTRLQSTRDLSHASITLDGSRVAVIGVMPPSFDFPSDTQVWCAGHLSLVPVLIGRLRPGLSRNQAQLGLKTVANQGTSASGKLTPTLESLHDALLGDRKPLLWILSAVSFLFLTLACAGVANLLLARGIRRRQEMVVRSVLGAERGRLIRQLLTETLLLAAAGGLLGLGFSALARHGLQLLFPEMMKDAAAFSPATIALVIALTLAATILCGVAPAFLATGADLNSTLKAGSHASSGPAPRRHFLSGHELFAGAQLILAMVLLISTGLLLRSMVARLNYPLGFDPKNIAVVRLPLPAAPQTPNAKHWNPPPKGIRTHLEEEAYRQATESTNEAVVALQESFYREATRRLKELPGVVYVAVMSTPPFTKGALDTFGIGLAMFDRLPGTNSYERIVAGLPREVSVGAFPLLGIRLLAGRDFLPSDIPAPDEWKLSMYHYFDNAPRPTRAVIVNEAFAHQAWPNQNPLGQTFRAWNWSPARVVGVVADIHESRQYPTIIPTLYEPFTANTTFVRSVTFIVKLRPGASVADLKKALPPVDPDAAPPTVLPLQESLGDLSIALALLSCFSVLGIVVAGLGVYATATLMAAAAMRETGVRLAIGAGAEQIGMLTLWRSLRLALLALPVGALGAWLLGGTLKHWLFQVGAGDPMSYLISAAVLLAIALAAGLWPALRAATTDPAIALRYDG